MADRKTRIDALVSNKRVTEAQRPLLEAMTDNQFELLVTTVETVVTNAEKDKPQAQDWHKHGEALYQERKAELVTNIKGSATNPFTDDQLKAMPFDQLINLSALAGKKVNMSGMVVGNTAPVANSEKGLELPGFAEAKKK